MRTASYKEDVASDRRRRTNLSRQIRGAIVSSLQKLSEEVDIV